MAKKNPEKDKRESGVPGGGAGRRDEVGKSGVYPISGRVRLAVRVNRRLKPSKAMTPQMEKKNRDLFCLTRLLESSRVNNIAGFRDTFIDEQGGVPRKKF